MCLCFWGFYCVQIVAYSLAGYILFDVVFSAEVRFSIGATTALPPLLI